MTLWKSLSIFMILLMGLFSFNGHTRAPAVDPVMGLSIEEYEKVDPADATPFDFTEQSTEPTAISAPLAPRSLQQTSSESKGPPTYFYILMSLLPFVIWYGVMKNLESLEEEVVTENIEDNTFDLNAQREKRAALDQNDDTDLPKAS